MNIVVINNFWKFPGTERWDFETISYETHISHEKHNVTYIVNPRGKTAITGTPGTYQLFEVQDGFAYEELEPIVRQVIAENGPVDRIIAFSENLLLVASKLRDTFSIPGPSTEETLLVRNKVLMKQRLKERGVRVPEFVSLPKDDAVNVAQQFVKDYGFPCIIKPVDAASSIGVSRIENEHQLMSKLKEMEEGDYQWEMEEFITGDIYHVDGLIDKEGNMLFCAACRYLKTCMEFNHESPLGAIMLPFDSELYLNIRAFTQTCLKELELASCPFHLELFLTDKNEIVFLEVGARVAGVDVPGMYVDALGINLFEHWINLIIDGTTHLEPRYDWNKYGAWLIFGLPENLPQKVTQSSDLGLQLSSLHKQFVPKVGDILIKEGGYCSLQSGRFLLSNDNYEQLQLDTMTLLNEFSIQSTPITEMS